MEVKPGYKQTEVGVIPEEWDVTTVGDEFTVQLGKMLDAERNTGIAKTYLGNRAVQWGLIDISNLPTVPMSQSDLEKFRLKKGDLLVCEGGEVGRSAIWDAPIDECYYQKALHRLRPKRDFDQRLMVDILREWSRRGLLANYVTQTSIAHLPRDKFIEVPIPRPPLPEQRAIAAALSDVDALLGGLDRLIAKKRDLKQAAMQQLLTGQTRLPGFSGAWELTRLRQFVTADKFAIVDGPFGSQLKVDEYVESGVPVIEMEHLADGMITSELARCITPTKFNDLKRSAVYPGDILISKTGSLGKLGVLPSTIERGLITSRLAKITLDPAKADRSFVLQFLLKLRRDGYWEQVSQGGTMQILGIGMLQSAPIPDITRVEQTAIAAVLSDMDAELAALEARRDKTRDLKQAMMQELLTGKTRLVKPEAAHA